MGCKNGIEKKSKNRQADSSNKKTSGKNEVICKKEHIERKEDGTIVKTVVEEVVVVDDNGGSNRKDDKKKDKKKEKNWEKSSDHSDDSSKKNKKSGDFDLSTLRSDALQLHNTLRAKHRAPPLKINKKLNDIAQKYAEYLAKNDLFEHSQNKMDGEDLGENLFMCGGIPISGKEMTQSWYDEIKDYNFNKPGYNSKTGHFTQVVWVGSNEVGFGAAKSKRGNYYGVANYYPPGNFINQMKENVLK